MKSLVEDYPLILMEAAVVEQLRRTDKVRLLVSMSLMIVARRHNHWRQGAD